MQNVAALRVEIIELAERQICSNVEIVFSREAWNPISAVTLRSIRLSTGLRQTTTDCRIPIANLYGFARHATVMLVGSTAVEEGERNSISCLRCATEADILSQQTYFVDLRENREWSPGSNYLFLAPAWRESGFKHVTLLNFVNAAMMALKQPQAHLDGERSHSLIQWGRTKNPYWLIRLIEINERLGDLEQSRHWMRVGRETFPTRNEFIASFSFARG